MKAFMVSQERPFILQLIQEIPDFKSWVQGYLKDGLEVLIGHTDMHLFQFFVDSTRWLVMQYKVFPIYAMWSPKDGLAIQLWKSNDQGHPKLPIGIPKHVPSRPIWGNDASKLIEKENFINNGISKYLEFWKLNILKDEMYARTMQPYIEYWEGILKCLSKPTPQQSLNIVRGFLAD